MGSSTLGGCIGLRGLCVLISSEVLVAFCIYISIAWTFYENGHMFIGWYNS